MEYTEYITVAVLCYNSSKTVIDTLNSIKSQSYKNIDLLINDDCSSDDTVKIVQCWIKNNYKRFRRLELRTHDVNWGINKSFDYILRESNTKWVKCIAADDILLHNCIEDNYKYSQTHKINSIIYSFHIPFVQLNGSVSRYKEDLYELYYLKKIGKCEAKKQYRMLLKKDIVFSSTGFVNRHKYIELGGIPLGIRNIEDWPLRLLFTKNGEKINVMETYTTMYRIGDSVSHTDNHIYNTKHLEQRKQLKKLLIYPHIPHIDLLFYFNEFVNDIRVCIIVKLFKNKKSKMALTVNKLMMIFDVYKWPKAIYNSIVSGRKVCK